MLPMKFFIAEQHMKSQWKLARHLVAHPDGERRWDRAYQYLLQQTIKTELKTNSGGVTAPELKGERDHESSTVCACLNASPIPGADH